jgi:hypothetical protein
MTGVVRQAFNTLRNAGARMDPGLTDAEVEQVQLRWNVRFCEDHAGLLRLGVPVGNGWVDWRHAAEKTIRMRLDAPITGLLFDVEYNEFWPASWGPRPDSTAEARSMARDRLSAWPRLLPVFRHRYLPPGPYPSPAPLLSVMQSDVVHYGLDLVEWVQREFFGVPLPEHPVRPPVGPWSRMADGCGDAEL